MTNNPTDIQIQMVAQGVATIEDWKRVIKQREVFESIGIKISTPLLSKKVEKKEHRKIETKPLNPKDLQALKDRFNNR